jgi:hypothetical protein
MEAAMHGIQVAMRALALGAILVPGACDGGSPGEDAATDRAETPADAGDDRPDAPADAGDALAPHAREVVQVTTTGIGVAAALGTPLAETAEGLHRDRPDQAETRRRVEQGVAGDSIVTVPSCVAFAWSELAATLTFTDCVAELNGLTLDGAVGLAVATEPEASITITLTALQVNGATFTGTVVVGWVGSPGSPGVLAEADLQFTSADGAATVTLEAIRALVTPASVTIGGTGHLQTDSLDMDFTLDGLTWQVGDCLPSGGTLTYQDGPVTVVVTFLPTTPETGAVQVKVGPLPAEEVALLEPCE